MQHTITHDCVFAIMTVPSGENVARRFDMALFGMVWLLRVRSEMRRCAKCRRDELLAAAQQDIHQTTNVQDSRLTLNQGSITHQTTSETLNTSDTTLFTLDTPGASGPAGSYCEVHGYIPPKEGIPHWFISIYHIYRVFNGI